MEEKMNNITVVKRNGNIEPLMLEKIHEMVNCACEGLSNVSASQIEMNSGLQFYAGITTDEIQQILVKSASDLISLEHPNYQYVAARLLLFAIRKRLYGGRIDMPHLSEHIKFCVEQEYYDADVYEKYSSEELDTINSFIDHDRDFLFTYAGLKQAEDRYLVQDRDTKHVFETPQFMYIMIALTIFANYPKDVRLSYVKRYYDVVSKHKINLPTPVMASVRTPDRQAASCCLIDVDDTLGSIIASDGAMMKYVSGGAGVGMDVSKIRGIKSKIRKGKVISSGLIPYLKKFQASLESCHQGGVRKGSMTAYVSIWHQEIEDIIVLKNNKGNDENRVRNIDYAIKISKLFYERYLQNGEITLFSPHHVPNLEDSFGTDLFDELYVRYENDPSIPKRRVKAQELFLNILKERSETGRIYIMNIDHCNSHSSFKDHISMSNLCVAGDTKIRIRCTFGFLDGKELRGEYEIEIKDLGEYLNPKTVQHVRTTDELIYKYDDYSGLEVLSYDTVKGEKVWSKVTAFAQTSPKAKVVSINKGELILTPDHKVYTTNRGYVEAKNLETTDFVIYNGREKIWKVKSNYRTVECLEEEIPVYDITVEGTHNFFANDILVHNCVEVTLPVHPIQNLEDEAAEISLCILGGLNVGTIKSDKELEECCELIVRALEELIDWQDYLVKAAEISTRARRSLGIGVMGLAHYLAKLGQSYHEQAAWNSCHKLGESIQYFLLKASNQLAKERGQCEYFSRTKYADGILPIDTYKKDVDEICSIPLRHDWEQLRQNILQYGLRHSTLSAIMPGESSSLMLNAPNGIEMPREHLSVKRRLKQIVPQYSSLKNNYSLLWDAPSNIGYLNIVAVLQKFIDQSISANTAYNPEMFPDKEVPMSLIVGDVLYAYKMGLKTLYYHNTYDSKKDSESAEVDELEKLINEIQTSEGEEYCEGCSI
jgi:ribonucleotide reductase alpha subunit